MSSLWLIVNTIVIDIKPVWHPNLDVSSSEVEVQIEMARVEFNTKEMTTLQLSNVIHLHLNILPSNMLLWSHMLTSCMVLVS